ncbi:MAG: NUDIX hydrolase [Spirochaetales bacterium]|nr:NUDIX hydrolase [Spirochaetales bacterium]
MSNRHSRCCAFLLNSLKELLLVEHETPEGKRYWWLPGGGLEENEEPVEGIRREIMEELGVEIDIHELFNFSHNNPDRKYKEYFVAIASIKEKQHIILDSAGFDKLTGYKWFSIENEDTYDPLLFDKDILPFVIEAKRRPCLKKLWLPDGNTQPPRNDTFL